MISAPIWTASGRSSGARGSRARIPIAARPSWLWGPSWQRSDDLVVGFGRCLPIPILTTARSRQPARETLMARSRHRRAPLNEVRLARRQSRRASRCTLDTRSNLPPTASTAASAALRTTAASSTAVACRLRCSVVRTLSLPLTGFRVVLDEIRLVVLRLGSMHPSRFSSSIFRKSIGAVSAWIEM